MVCYLSASYPESEQVVAAMAGKRSALLLASEERYPAVAIGVVAQLQEMSRYLDHQFVGVVNGVDRQRGRIAEVGLVSDPLKVRRVRQRREGA
jgi:hypothetical protein